jgi:NhaP-type Na+/H+ or K+/H+ antiporter
VLLLSHHTAPCHHARVYVYITDHVFVYVCVYVPLCMCEQVARAVAIGVLYPLLCTGRVGYAMTWRTAVVMVWAGLRGAVSD